MLSKLTTIQEGVKIHVFHCIHFLPCIPVEYTYSFFISPYSTCRIVQPTHMQVPSSPKFKRSPTAFGTGVVARLRDEVRQHLGYIWDKAYRSRYRYRYRHWYARAAVSVSWWRKGMWRPPNAWLGVGHRAATAD